MPRSTVFVSPAWHSNCALLIYVAVSDIPWPHLAAPQRGLDQHVDAIAQEVIEASCGTE